MQCSVPARFPVIDCDMRREAVPAEVRGRGALQILEGITAAQEALELLLPAGDFAGALDVLGDLTAAGAPLHVAGLHAFRALPQQLAACEEVRLPLWHRAVDVYSCKRFCGSHCRGH